MIYYKEDMNRFFLTLGLIGVFLATALAAQSVNAQTSLPESQVENIRQNCVTAQTTLSQLHVSDALLRVNRGTLYENISTKLMAQLNSRIALNRLEGIRMSSITLEYDRQREIFRTSYIRYEESMSNTLKINCAEKPVEFYESVELTRQQRNALHESTLAITALLSDYKTAFEDFAKGFERQAE